MRRDAEERREALIRAAADCFSERGFLVPLEDIADRAGVGRGTLYRNFRNRMDLALAIFEREIDQAAAGLDVAAPLPELIGHMVEKGAKTSALFARLAADIPLDDESYAAFKALGRRFEAALKPVVDKAHADGVLRADADAATVMLAFRLIGNLRSIKKPVDDMPEMLAAATDLIMRGLSPR